MNTNKLRREEQKNASRYNISIKQHLLDPGLLHRRPSLHLGKCMFCRYEWRIPKSSRWTSSRMMWGKPFFRKASMWTRSSKWLACSVSGEKLNYDHTKAKLVDRLRQKFCPEWTIGTTKDKNRRRRSLNQSTAKRKGNLSWWMKWSGKLKA